VMGGGLPAQIWREVMALAHRGQPALPLAGVAASAKGGPENRAPDQPMRPANATPTRPPASAQQRHPQHSIDPAFITRLLDDEAAASETSTRKPAPTTPAGRMSLGHRP
jgi:membrane peptidoglycan carboxypeptidase